MSSKDGRRKTKPSDPEVGGRILLVIFFGFIFCLILLFPVVILFHTLNDPSGFSFEWADLFVGIPVIIAVLAMLGASGYVVVNNLKFRRFNPGELARLQSLAEADRPEMSSDSLVYRFNKKIGLGKTGAVYVDQAGRMLHFFNCHVPRGFWNSQPSKWFSCAFDELRAVTAFKAPYVKRGADSSYRVNRGPESLTVVTVVGKAKIPGRATGYEEVRDIIKKLKPVAEAEASTEHPATRSALLWGSGVGLFSGLWYASLFPNTANNDIILYLCVLVGPVVGIAGSCLLIWFAGRFLKINLAEPMVSSLVTGVVGLMLASPLKDQSVVHMVGILAAVAGGVIGLLGQFTKKNDVESKQDKRESVGDDLSGRRPDRPN